MDTQYVLKKKVIQTLVIKTFLLVGKARFSTPKTIIIKTGLDGSVEPIQLRTSDQDSLINQKCNRLGLSQSSLDKLNDLDQIGQV